MAVKANIHEAKTHFSELLERAHRGEEVIIAKAGKPYARLVPVRPAGTRQPGEFRGQIHGDILGGAGPDDSSWGVSVYLLDSCALLWWMADAPELGRQARRAIADQRNEIIVSAASLWEISIKQRRGRLTGVDDYLARYTEWHERWGFALTVIEPADAVAAGRLSWEHEDPFDRMLVVQAQRLGARLVTCDEAIRRFVADCVW